MSGDLDTIEQALIDWTRDTREWKIAPAEVESALARVRAALEAANVLADAYRDEAIWLRDQADAKDEALRAAVLGLEMAIRVHAAVNFDTAEDNAVRDRAVETMRLALLAAARDSGEQ